MRNKLLATTIIASLALSPTLVSAAPACLVFKGNSNSKGGGQAGAYPEPLFGGRIWNLRMDNVLENNPREPLNDTRNGSAYPSAFPVVSKAVPGHALRLADRIAAIHPDGVVTIPCGRGGLKVADAHPPSSDTSTVVGACEARVNLAKQLTGCTVRLVVWAIGDADTQSLTDANMVQERMHSLINYDRGTLAPLVPTIYYQLGTIGYRVEEFPHWNRVRLEIADIDRTNASMIESKYFEHDDGLIHLTTQGHVQFADALFNLAIVNGWFVP